MRVVMVTSWFPTTKNPSSGSFVVKDCQALAHAGADLSVVHLVAPNLDDGTRHTTVQGIQTARIPMATNNPLAIAWARLLLQPYIASADIVHTQAISAIEPFVFRRPGKPWVHTEHWSGISNPHNLSPTWQKLQPVLKQLERLPDVVVAVNNYLAEPIRAVRGKKPVAVIPCQVPSPAQLVERRPVRAPLRLISTGGLVPGKRPLLAVQTLAELRERGRTAELTWLGDGPLRTEVEQLAVRLGVTVSLLGHVSAEDVRRHLGDADMFIGPSEGENFFVSAAEAIVNGRPLVVGDVGGHGEYISPAVGELVSGEDPADYAAAVLRVDERTDALSAADIAATIGERFSSTTVAGAYLELYDHLASR
ncbi:glycosyltransferase involved in cell wall biosynthesis [Trueperella bonasi]|uniref:Glycosyltransferase involved in cell wall biosynthesis n=1 Tax=Trueperella bonasi TaxID=312286 RepID=A0ABT9NF51_9ACTO|nr:glycosyltransferase family 4 protein [Trueperella bonasi]MDP9806011.1 glycosyltransferase involved in cell wall biosynthesis [Trueperella bonasi]